MVVALVWSLYSLPSNPVTDAGCTAGHPDQAEEQQPDKHKPVTSVQAPASVWLVRMSAPAHNGTTRDTVACLRWSQSLAIE